MFQSTNQIYVYNYIYIYTQDSNITYIIISGKRLQFANWKITIFKFDIPSGKHTKNDGKIHHAMSG